MARYIEIEEIVRNHVEVMPDDYYKTLFSEKGVNPPYNKRNLLWKTTIIDVDSIKIVEPTAFRCKNMEDPIIPREYTVYFSDKLWVVITVEEYEKKIKNLLFENKNSLTTDIL